MVNRILAAALMFAASGAGAADLFKGRDFSGWELHTEPAASIASVFSVQADGVIASAGKPSGYLATTGTYRNYRLHVEWRWPGKPGNGGVLLHISPGPMDRVWPLSQQIQTKFGNVGDVLPMAGASFAEALTGDKPPVKAHIAADSERAAGEWNSADIVSRDGVIEVSVNGVLQNRVTNAAPREGKIGFQLEGTPYELRRVELAPLD